MASFYEWDENKAQSNLIKHGVSFAEAKSVFNDTSSITQADPHNEEDRWVDIGCSSKGRILVVIYAERGDHIRIISCRKAVRQERKIYEEKFEKQASS